MTEREQHQWADMTGKSFCPRQWFRDIDYADVCGGDKIMWVYRQNAINTWTVGYYDPDGNWHHDSIHEDSQAAAARVHWLNGGEPEHDKPR